jgi:hypothetical protein
MLLLLLRLCHLIILLYILLTPFTDIPVLLFIHALFSILLLIHWYTQSDNCFLTYLESKITGQNINDGFVYKIISPFYNISKPDVKKMVWTITIFLLFISLHKCIMYIKNHCNKSFYKCIYYAYTRINM